MDGMAYALEIVKKQGIEALEKEVKYRNAQFVPLEVSQETIKETVVMCAERIQNTMAIVALSVLHDTFGYGKIRLQRYQSAFDDRCDVLSAKDPDGDYYAVISDFAAELAEKYDMEFDMEVLYRVEADRRRG